MTSLLDAAFAWHDAGCAVIPARPDGSKAPAVDWREYMDRRPTPEQLHTWFGPGSAYDGLGIVTGATSGQLEMFELEGRAVTGRMSQELVTLFTDHGMVDLWHKVSTGYAELTPSGGMHYYFRVKGTARRNTKLARRPGPGGVEVLIETRGEGGFSVVAPSAGRTHQTGAAWLAIAGTPAAIPTISEDERDALHAIASMLDQMPAAEPVANIAPLNNSSNDSTGRPGDDYNARASWDEILGGRGWTKVRKMGDGYAWRRPGKNQGISATTGQAADGTDRLYVFSSSTEFEPEKPYTKFAALALLEHDGRYDEAARSLRKAGYGSERPRLQLVPGMVSTADIPGDRNGLKIASAQVDLWERRDVLEHVRQFARARRTSPLGSLGVLLARVLAATPPFVVLPPIVGTVASLNLFVALVGPSGAGKGAAEGVAAEAVDVGDVITQTTGSGEGIAHAYMKREKGALEQHTAAVLFSVPEIDTLGALGDRRGSTLLPELRRAWSGERLGFAYSDPAKRLVVPAHKYRLCLVAGVQPGRAGTLLDDSDGGTPQRFLWMPATDPDAPQIAPECPEPLKWKGPVWRSSGYSGKAVMHVCDEARNTIDNARLARLRGDGEVLDGHALLNRLKVAAALAILDRRADVTDDDWEIAGLIQAISDATRTGVTNELREAAQRRNAARGETEASRAVMVAERVEEAAIQRVTRSVMRALSRCNGQGATEGELRRTLASRDRGHLEPALSVLADTGLVKVEETDNNGPAGRRFQLVTGARP